MCPTQIHCVNTSLYADLTISVILLFDDVLTKWKTAGVPGDSPSRHKALGQGAHRSAGGGQGGAQCLPPREDGIGDSWGPAKGEAATGTATKGHLQATGFAQERGSRQGGRECTRPSSSIRRRERTARAAVELEQKQAEPCPLHRQNHLPNSGSKPFN